MMNITIEQADNGYIVHRGHAITEVYTNEQIVDVLNKVVQDLYNCNYEVKLAEKGEVSNKQDKPLWTSQYLDTMEDAMLNKRTLSMKDVCTIISKAKKNEPSPDTMYSMSDSHHSSLLFGRNRALDEIERELGSLSDTRVLTKEEG